MQFLFIDLQLKFKHHQDRVGQISNRIDFPVILAYGHLLNIYKPLLRAFPQRYQGFGLRPLHRDFP